MNVMLFLKTQNIKKLLELKYMHVPIHGFTG